VGEAVSWRVAMAEALYGAEGFFRRPDGGAAAHFRTSAIASPLFGTALLRLLVAVDETLGRPRRLDLIDIGAGPAHLLRRLAVLAPAYLAQRMHLGAVEVAARPVDLPDHIAWYDRLPSPGTVTGLVLATEWLDNVPLDIAQVDDAGTLRYVLVEPTTGHEVIGGRVDEADSAWATRWWSESPWQPGIRVELGQPRDEAWASAVAGLGRGVALTVDYGHMWYDRPHAGTLTGFRAGRINVPVPDGSCDITAHVAVDAVCAAGEAVAGRAAALISQRQALQGLGVDSTRPPLVLANRDPAGYVRALSAATQAAELMDTDGLGGHYWVLQPVGIDPDALPEGLRP
jgi:SAM-dependent MidA family methyltransferase